MVFILSLLELLSSRLQRDREWFCGYGPFPFFKTGLPCRLESGMATSCQQRAGSSKHATLFLFAVKRLCSAFSEGNACRYTAVNKVGVVPVRTGIFHDIFGVAAQGKGVVQFRGQGDIFGNCVAYACREDSVVKITVG